MRNIFLPFALVVALVGVVALLAADVDARSYTPTSTMGGPLPPFCRQPDLDIPDGDPEGVTDFLTIPEVGTISDVNVSIATTHTRVGELVFELQHSSGITVMLIDRPGHPASGSGCLGDDIDATLDDEAGTSAEDACSPTPPALSGPLIPNQSLHILDGEPLSGTWELFVSDSIGGDPGILHEWCVIVETVPGSTPTSTPTPTHTHTPTPSHTATTTATGSATATATATGSATATATATGSATATATATGSATATATATGAATVTATATGSVTPTATPTGSATATTSGSAMYLPLILQLPTPTATLTPTPNPCLTQEVEPNDTRGQAGAQLKLCPGTIQGSLPDGDNDDLYRIEIDTVPTTVNLSLRNLPAGTNFDLYLYDAVPTQLARSVNLGTQDEQITYTFTTPGIYYLRVYPREGRSTSPYTLSWN